MKNLLMLSLITSTILYSSPIENLPIKEIKEIKTNKKIEPSGLTIFNNQLIVVSDNGRICSIEQENCVKLSKKYDLEGASTDGKILYVGIEGKDNIGIVNKDMSIERINIPRKYKGKKILKKGGDGIEALTFLYKKEGRDFFAISNQSDKIKGEDSSELIILSIKNKKAKNY